MSGKLLARVDGELLPDDQARALWQRFSAHMEEHRGDLAGFAAKEGFKSVHPGMESGTPVLLASHEAPQGPYQNVGSGGSGGGSRKGQPASKSRQKRGRH